MIQSKPLQCYCKIVKLFVKIYGVSSNEQPDQRPVYSSSVFTRPGLLLILSPSRRNLKSSLALLGTRLHGVYP
jgi:hypothetical protein